MSSHFPPSSPFLDSTTADEDPFSGENLLSKNEPKQLVINSPFNKNVLATKKFDYPTPNPSSTTGARSSSPARRQETPDISVSSATVETPNGKTLLKDTLRVRLYSQQTIKLGRSSKCDFFIKSKYASRNHLKLKYDEETNELTISCKGYNGVLVELGEVYNGYIKEVQENVYKFIKKEQEENFKEIQVYKNEEIILPFNEKLTLNIKGFKILLDIINDLSETEDELPVLKTDIKPIERVKTIEVPRLQKSLSNESVKFKIREDPVRSKSLEPETKENPKPLGVKSENSLNQETQRRRKAEPGLSPQKKKIDSKIETSKKKYINPREKIENLKINEILEEISLNNDLESIKNVLINHLAFSRLSQTPLKQLQTVSHSIQTLSRYQLRAILADLKCIGVIYRHGKDAAGKPLDEEYYYDVENDDDMERTNLVTSIKGSSGLRNCRKTHKQYFWKKPVTKK